MVIIAGSFWDTVEIICEVMSGSYWDHGGTILGLCWHYGPGLLVLFFGLGLGSFFDIVGISRAAIGKC